ncbi:hypothetical protein Bca4012_070274 [Brassica carinata]|uniref:BnaC05g08500D protein n=2 Tax=Brassica napus TaxID=3708 RepID=A0A078G1Z1_BRANA|nr:uncharacterized protein BNAC05G08500D [Brassica napus]KAH0877174.1 hypothetical protein HID58_064568 [Brassica napus]CAF1924877.1 unnamed protein product [Brassica napus]CDY19341.1 BnaC05g08500D [Brassica napus]
MGCCISATATATATTDKKNEPVSGKKTALPPVAVVEEETVVKEVLSGTTLVTSLNDNSAMETTTNKVPEEEEEEEKKPGAVDASPDPVLTENGSVEPGKGSEVSEICSLSESLLSIVSGYEEEEVKQMKPQGVRQRSPAKYRDRVMANNYPTRRSDMSPRKRNTEGGEGAGSVRLVPSGAGQRDPTERSERKRSRSPAINRPVMVGPSRNHYASTDNGGVMMKKGQSPGRVRPYPNKNGSEQDCHRQWPSQNDNSTSNDSFENPLVSLECFIFL